MDLLSHFWKKLQLQYKCAFFSTIVFGIISQGMGLFNKFTMHDELLYSFTGDDSLTHGRWGSYLLQRAEKAFFGDGLFSLPVINGLITIICIAAALCFLVHLLRLRSPLLCILLGGVMVSIPCVTHMMSDLYVTHYYSFAILLAVLGPWLILKRTKWYSVAAGIGLMVFSTAIYQAYIPVMLSVFLFGMINMSISADGKEEQGRLYRKIPVILFSCAEFISIYFLLTSVINKRFGITLTEYKNISSMGSLPLTVYLQRVLTAYREFFHPSKNIFYDIFPGNIRLLYYVTLFFFLVLSGKLLYDHKKDPVQCGMLFLMLLLIPLSVNFIFVMIDSSDCWIMMLYSKAMFFVIFTRILEITLRNPKTLLRRSAGVVCAAVLFLFVWMYCRYDNICYLQMTLLQSQMTRYYSTLVTRIQSAEGYDSWKYVAYIGSPQPGKNDNSIEPFPELDSIMAPPYWGLTDSLKGPWQKYMKLFCGYSAHEADPAYFIDRPDVQAMPGYPADGSIKVIDDVVVVKF